MIASSVEDVWSCIWSAFNVVLAGPNWVGRALLPPRPSDDDATAAKQQLLERTPETDAPALEPPLQLQQHLTPDADATVSKAPAAAVCGPPPPPGRIIVMRHGHREDEQDSDWALNAARPWDPPLSQQGCQQAQEVAAQMAALGVDLVVTSPFLRCLQTSAGVVSQLGLPQGSWVVDWALGEVCDPRVLFGARRDVMDAAAGRPLPAWMWCGASLESTLHKLAEQDPLFKAAGIRPLQLPGTDPPSVSYPEILEQGLERYASALRRFMQCAAGRNVLLVTHGECVRQAVLSLLPGSEVFEVRHTGYVVLERQQKPVQLGAQPPGRGSGGGRWQLVSEMGETGVLWFEDDEDGVDSSSSED